MDNDINTDLLERIVQAMRTAAVNNPAEGPHTCFEAMALAAIKVLQTET
jgi:hypothetical protein